MSAVTRTDEWPRRADINALLKIKPLPDVPPDQLRNAPSTTLRCGSQIILESYAFPAADSPEVGLLGQWLSEHAATDPWTQAKLKNDVVLVSDDAFSRFSELFMEIQTHVSIDHETGVVKEGPWNEESIPADSLLTAAITVPPPLHEKARVSLPGTGAQGAAEGKRKLAALLRGRRIQMAGDRSLGKGRVSVKLIE